MYDFSEDEVKKHINTLFHEKAIIHLSHPFGDLKGSVNFDNKSLKPVFISMPDRGKYLKDITYHFFWDCDYLGVTG